MKVRRLALSASLSLPLMVPLATAAAPAGAKLPAARPRLLLAPLGDAAEPPTAAARTPVEAGRLALAELRRRPGLLPAELAAPEVIPVGEGHLLRYAQTHRGVPVLGGEVSLRLDARGRVLRLVRDVLDEDRLPDVTPRLTAEAARRAVEALGRGAALEPELQIDLESGRLVWVVPSLDLRRLENAHYLVDAARGEVLRRIERLRFADRFRVYRPNPVVSPAPESLSLPGGAGGPFTPDPATPRQLTSKLLRALNCIDDGTTRDVPGLGSAVHLCAARPTAVADGDGNFDGLQPLVNDADGVCPTAKDGNLNAFAEAHMYFHAATAYDRFRRLFQALGRADFKLRVSTGADPQPLPMIVNLCMPDFSNPGDTRRGLQQLDNAFFSPGGTGGLNQVLTGVSTDSLGFGMGRKANFALDGDVIYHEFTHAVVFSRGRLMFSVIEDDYGQNTDPGAMNEGLADYFSSSITGDPRVGEYASRNLTGAGNIRDLDNQDRCAEQRVGQVHEDSKAFSGALWQARLAVAGEPDAPAPAAGRRDAFDQAVLAALDGSGSRPTMTDVAKLVVQEVAQRAAQLGEGAEQKATEAFTAHGVLPECNRVIRRLDAKPLLCIDGTESRSGRKLMTGHVQWRVEVPGGVDTLKIGLRTFNGGCSGNPFGPEPPDPKLQLAVRAADEPLTWQRDDGNQDQLLSLRQSGSNWSGQVAVKPGVYHVMIVNAGGSAVGQDIRLALSCQAPEGCQAPEPPKVTPMDAEGCGCRVGGRSSSDLGAGLGGALGLLAALGLLLRRRR